MSLRVKQGWFVVFNTLTVDNHNQNEVFNENSTAWTDYVRTVDRAIGIRLFGTWRSAIRKRQEAEEFHTYFAVVERGSSSGRLHIHILHFMKGLPYGCTDPNTGRQVASYREISRFKKFWKYGFSAPIAVRFDQSDAYGRNYWRWPVKLEKVGYVSIPVSHPDAIVFYIGKYMTKEFDKPMNREEIKWRTKMSQSLGKTVCQMIVNRSTKDQLELILRMKSSNVLQIKNRNLPLWTLKKLAMMKILKLKKKLTPKKCWTMLRELKPRDSIMSLLKHMIQKKDIHKPLSFGNLRVLKLLVTVGSDLIKKVKK